ncbi:hypothetical protein GTQ43_28135 [Nostoc sp. KVJ3]|nr:hypothetical protein [Nostoc sp. KVJ3]MCW5317534.1 hypothetical protein [Nostoc sp. KVJ3]
MLAPENSDVYYRLRLRLFITGEITYEFDRRYTANDHQRSSVHGVS